MSEVKKALNDFNYLNRLTEKFAFPAWDSLKAEDPKADIPLHPSYGLSRRVNWQRYTALEFPSKLSYYDDLFGLPSVDSYRFGDYSKDFMAFVARLVTAFYLSSDRYRPAHGPVIDSSHWINYDLLMKKRRWITKQMRGYRGFEKGGYLLPDPVPFSEVVREEFGLDPIYSARDFILTKGQVDDIIKKHYNPSLFKPIVALGGRETPWFGVKQYVVYEDFVPKTPLSALPFDRLVARGLKKLLDFLDRVYEDPSVLDYFFGDEPRYVVYTRFDYANDGISLPVVLPDLGLPWGYLFYFMSWYAVTYYDHGVVDIGLQGTLTADKVMSSLGTYRVFLPITPFVVFGDFGGHVTAPYARERAKALGFIKSDLDILGRSHSYAAPGLFSAWRIIMYSLPDAAAGKNVRMESEELINFLAGFIRSWIYGFGYIVREDDTYWFFFGDPYTVFSPPVVTAYNSFALGKNAWFSYLSVPFFEVMRKFLFMVFEIWRRYGFKVVRKYGFRPGSVDLSQLFPRQSPPFRDLPFDVYEHPYQFDQIPFHVLFNIGMSILPMIVYQDVSAFRSLWESAFYYITMHYYSELPDVVLRKVEYVDETGKKRTKLEKEVHTTLRLWEKVGWYYRSTYTASSKVYVSASRNLAKGDVFALYENLAYAVWNSPLMPGIVMHRFPFYDENIFEFQIQYFQNHLVFPVSWQPFDATGAKYIAFFDESTDVWIPYARNPVYLSRGSGFMLSMLFLRGGYIEPLIPWFVKAWRGTRTNTRFNDDLVRRFFRLVVKKPGDERIVFQKLKALLKGDELEALYAQFSKLFSVSEVVHSKG